MSNVNVNSSVTWREANKKTSLSVEKMRKSFPPISRFCFDVSDDSALRSISAQRKNNKVLCWVLQV